MSDMDAIVTEFVQEGNEKADEVERHLLHLERNPTSRESITQVFRAMHSIKGATGFLGFTKLGTLAHTGESLLARLRDGGLAANAEIIAALLSLVDTIRKIVSEIEVTGHEGNGDYTTLINTLTRLHKSG
jgi:two-component system, chemotaxis family, sensor kinase CheA